MNNNTFEVLEFNKIKERVKEYTASDLGKKLVDNLYPSDDIIVIKRMLNDTSEAKAVLNRNGYVPLVGIHDITEILSKLEKGMILNPEQLIKVSDFLRGCRKMKKFMKNQDYIAPNLSSYSNSISEFEDIEDEINFSIEGNRVSDKASPNIASIRKKISIVEDRIEKKLNSILSSNKYKEYLQEFYISKRHGKYVIPVKASFKSMIEGSVIDKSSTGSTVFIEPYSIAKFTNEINLLKFEEEKEEYQILSTLTGFVGMYLNEIKINTEAIAEYDFVFAKGKYSNSINGIEPIVNEDDYIKIIQGKHPLLDTKPVPLDFEIGKDYRTLMITGPNTGGKTVVLKTIGLLTIMTQSGLHIQVNEGTNIGIFKKILLDIGDKQSIEMSLSTFSSHIKNIVDILNNISDRTLVLFDEIGTGTDPSEGSALAASILEEIYKMGAITLATTHYGKLKEFAFKVNGFENGCMGFDNDTLKPQYKLIIGKGGNSNAFWISEKLGMKNEIITRAREYVDNDIDTNFTFKDKEIKMYNSNKIKSKKTNIEDKSYKESFEVGDCVKIISSGEYGIIYKTEDEFGNLTLLLKDEYIEINRKRVTIHIKKEKLYPEDYDLDIVFVPWEERKVENAFKKGRITKKDYDKILNK